MQHYVVTQEALVKLVDAFAGTEEADVFIKDLVDLADEMLLTSLMSKRVDDDSATTLFLKQLYIFAIFCREHLDLIHEMIRKLEYTTMTEEEIKKLKG